MNVIQRICEKYQIEYNLMPDFRMRTINMEFGPGVSMELQDQIMDGLNCMGIYVEDMGTTMRLEVSPEDSEEYLFSVSGKEMFRFSRQFFGMPLAGYEMSEAVVWTVYILASRKDWLDPYQGKYISCRCFSARQQAAALQIMNSVARQYQGSVPAEQIRREFDHLCGYIRDVAGRAPRFSAQPIEASVFEKYKGRPMEASLQEIAGSLFAAASFEAEADAYCDLVKGSNAYRRLLEDATQHLVETAYDLPIMAVSHMFTELGTLTDEIEPVSISECSRLLKETVRFSLTASGLRQSFQKVDDVYLQMLKAKLEVDFLRSVSERARAMIDREFMAAKRSIMQLRNALGRFCFVREDSFGDNTQEGYLSWKQLSQLEDRYIYSKDISWTPESLNGLQSVLKSTYSPHIWICSEKLRNLSEMAAVTDSHLTKAAPVLDERLVWAVWVDVK